MNILIKIKLALYVVSLIEVITFGELFKRGGGIKMLVITLVLLAVNFLIYKFIAKRKKDYEIGK
ncbi:MAG: hypothetical protein LBO62_06245 [Endomicrobium sp.]|jgi:hypothetical protein|nr:hypothetical protein [Endomicrobium sp.]